MGFFFDSTSLYIHTPPISSSYTVCADSCVHPQPKAYAINHATALGGRDTLKVLMALLDEEALTPPCPNKADLLSEDQPILDGAEGTCVLMLFRLATVGHVGLTKGHESDFK